MPSKIFFTCPVNSVYKIKYEFVNFAILQFFQKVPNKIFFNDWFLIPGLYQTGEKLTVIQKSSWWFSRSIVLINNQFYLLNKVYTLWRKGTDDDDTDNSTTLKTTIADQIIELLVFIDLYSYSSDNFNSQIKSNQIKLQHQFSATKNKLSVK